MNLVDQDPFGNAFSASKMSTKAPATSCGPNKSQQALRNNEPINLLRGWPAPSLLPPALLLEAAQKVFSDPSMSVPGLSYGPDEGYLPLRETLADYLSTFYNRTRPSTSSPITSDRITITGGASQNLASLLSAFTDPSYTRKVFVSEPAYFLSFPIFEDAGFNAGSERMVGVSEDEEGVDLVTLEKQLEESERSVDSSEEWRFPRYKPGFAKIYKYVIYCVPSFSNPSGRTTSLRRREGLVRLARKYDALVVCDDVYDFLQWGVDSRGQEQAQRAGSHGPNDRDDDLQRALLPRVVDIDHDLDGGAERPGADGFGNVASNGSFSKILGPGLRVGWCEGTPKLAYGVSQTGATRSGGAPSQLTSTYIVPLLESGKLQHHISRTLRPAYKRRYARLRAAIVMHLEPLGFTLLSPTSLLPAERRNSNLGAGMGGSDGGDDIGDNIAGGFFAWLSVPAHILEKGGGAKGYAARCLEEEQVVISPGINFEVPSPNPPSDKTSITSGGGGKGKSRFEAEFRLCFAYVDEDDLEEGVRRMGVVAARVLDEDVDTNRHHSSAFAAERLRDGGTGGDGAQDEDEGYVIVEHEESEDVATEE